jgi:hypothetical protein
MKRIIFLFTSIILLFTGCASLAAQQMPADYIPQYAIDEAERFKSNFLRENSESASDLRYRFFYNADGNACLEYTVVPKGGYIWSRTTWLGYMWGGGSGSIGMAIPYTLSKKNADEAQYRIEQRRRDPAFREIERIVLQIANEFDYDFETAFGIRAKHRNPQIKKAVCDGYSDAITRAFANHQYVASIEKWMSDTGNHAWNVLNLRDGRKLYCDATWYDGNTIDDEGYVVTIPKQDPVNLTFDINEFNSQGGAIENATGRLLQTHFSWRDARMVR